MTPFSIAQSRFIPPSSEWWMNDFDFSSEPESSVEDGGSTLLFTRTNEDYQSNQICSGCLNITPDNALPPQYLTIAPIGTYFKRNIGQISGGPSFVTINKITTGFVSGAIVLGSLENIIDYSRKDVLGIATITQPKTCVTETAKSLIHNLNLGDKINNIINILNKNYPSLRSTSIDVNCDPEIAGSKYLCFTLTISGNPLDILEQERLCKKEIYENVGAIGLELLTVNYRWS